MPRSYNRKSSRATAYTQEALQSAIDRINNKELSYNSASRIYGIPKSTLSDRVLKKTAVVSATLGRSTAIPIKLESQLANGLRVMEKWGWGLSREEVLDITEEFVRKNNLTTPFKNGRPGPDWFISFRQRHNLSIKKPQPVEYLRKKMTDPFVIHEYFTLLDRTLRDLKLTPNRIWNLDETSVYLDPTKTKVVGAKGRPCTRTTCGSAKENVTVLTTVNADGQKLDPLIGFNGKYMYKQWMMENQYKYDFELAYAASKNGWIETEIFYNYMLNVIIPNIGEERPVLFLYDGHVSHVDNNVIALAVENNITILKLPAHTSHLLQPFDLAVFKSFKTTWDKNLVKWQRQNVGVKLRKQCFAKMFADAWQDTKPEVIRNGFKKAGIHPFNPAVIPKEKFDPIAYARRQKCVSQNSFKQPESLTLLCVEEIHKIMTYTSSAYNSTNTHSETTLNSLNLNSTRHSKPISTSFEDLLLQKVTQYPQNKITIKLKRVAKGADVITRTFLEKQEEMDANKLEQKEVQKTMKKKPKQLTESKKNDTDTVKPGPSGNQKHIKNKEESTNTSTIFINKTNCNTKKGKGIGKKSRPGKENMTSYNNYTSTISALNRSMTDSTPNKNDPTAKSNNSEVITLAKNTLKQIEKTNPAQKTVTTKSVKKRKRSLSSATTDESIQMSAHSDSDLLDSLSDILSDCDLWSKTDSVKYERNETEEQLLLTKEQEIEEIVKEIHEVENQPHSHVDAYEKNRQDRNSAEINGQNCGKKVTLLSSVKFTPDNQVFYKIRGDSQINLIEKDWDLFKNHIPKKKVKINNSPMKKIIKDHNLEINKEEEVKTNMKSYDIGDTVLVRYYGKTWKYYAGVIENINYSKKLYTISFYKTIGKKKDVKFVLPKRRDHDTVPHVNIVKEIELLQIKEYPAEFILMKDSDSVYF